MGIYDSRKNPNGLSGALSPTTTSLLDSLINPARARASDHSAALSSPAERTNLLAELYPFASRPPATPGVSLNSLGSLLSPTPHNTVPVAPRPMAPVTPRPALPVAVKRKAFFSFHFYDLMRVNVVNAWKIAHPESALIRSFYDSSLWESRKLEGDEAVKRLIREGVCYTSAVCVLIGSETWLRRWVKYEVARAIIDGRGLLAVHLNNIRHHQTKTPHPLGLDPLDFIGIGKVESLGKARYYLFEKLARSYGPGQYSWEWHRYKDYTDPVERPAWVRDPPADYVMPLSANADLYDHIADQGHKNIGTWMDRAARRAGR